MGILDPTFKAAWCAALRSGKYKQGTTALTRRVYGEQRHCCLGVGADVAGQLVTGDAQGGLDAQLEWPIVYSHEGYWYGPNMELDVPANVVPTFVEAVRAKQVTMEDDDLIYLGLSRMNDAFITHATIADIIEEHL